MALNVVALMGRLTQTPELRTTTNGISVTSFSIAVDRKFQSGGEKLTDFIDCVAWRNTAEFINRYFGKGDMIAINGNLQVDNYTDKNGKNCKSVKVSVENASFCGSKASSTENSTTSYTTQANDFTELADDDDLPF